VTAGGSLARAPLLAVALMAQAGPSGPSLGTRRMADRLERLAEASDATRLSYAGNKRAETLRRRYLRERDTRARLEGGLSMSVEELNSGATQPAIDDLLELQDLAAMAGLAPDEPLHRTIRDWLGLAYLRLGEQENCLAHHDAESCILPIRGGGLHRATRGSTLALGHFEGLLRDHPEDLRYRWLYGLAAMTLGKYPDGVPAEWRIPASAFDSGIAFPRFRNVAQAAGVAVNQLSGGVVLEDLDGDGRLDLMVSSWDLRDQLRYFRNDGRGGFEERTEQAGIQGITGGLNLVHADYDNDGDADVFVLRGAWLGAQGRHPNSLLRNAGDGTFEDVTEQAGLLSFHPTQTAAFGDYDGDGRLDLFVGNESKPDQRHPCELYRNRGDGTFTDVAAEVGLDHVGFVKAAVWGDYDNDGRIDLFLSRFDEPNVLFRNDGPGSGSSAFRFRDVTVSAGVAEPRQSFPAWFWDYDNDGWLDLLVGAYPGFAANSLPEVVGHLLARGSDLEPLALYRNRRDGTFVDVAAESGLAHPLLPMGSNYGDVDGDGFADAYFGTGEPSLATLVPNRMFRNVAGERFEDVTAAGGFGHLQKGHGIAFGDVDDDGDLDVYAVMGGAYGGDVYPNALFENPGTPYRWLTLELEGVTSNRSAIGARVAVIVEDEGGGERAIHVLVGTGGSFGSSSLRQELGLGAAKAIRRLEVRWPGAREPQLVEDVALDRFVRLREGESSVRVLERSKLSLGR